MDKMSVLKHVDHTLLNPCATWEEIKVICEQAIELQTASVCIPPSYVKRVFDTYGGQLKICTVIGFPLGYQTAETKAAETENALRDGADEIDMVINIGDMKNGDYDKVTGEIKQLKKITGDKILKVIVETCYLTEAQKVAACQCVTEGGADFIKTSTGFGSGGATEEDILLFKQHIGPNIKMKASGGIRTKEDFIKFIELGCERLGTSGAAKVFDENSDNQSSDY